MSKLYDDIDFSKMTEEQKILINMVEELSNKLLGDKSEKFMDYMKKQVVSIKCSRAKTEIDISEAEESELLDIIFPNIIKRLLNYYSPEERPHVILKVLKECKDGKEELCKEKD